MRDPIITIGAMYAALCPHELLAKIVPRFKIQGPRSCKFVHQGVNDSYKITSDDGNFLLRVYRQGWRKIPDIQFEVDAICYLDHKGANVAYPIETREGGYITRVMAPEGERHVILTQFAEGRALTYEDANDAARYGQAVAQIHQCSDGFSSRHGRFKLDLSHLVEKPLERIRPYLAHRADDWKILNDYARTLTCTIDDAPSDLLDYGFCHGDLHGWNAHLHNDELTFFDFDCGGYGLRAYDIAVFKWSARVRNREHEWWGPYINAYQAVRDLSRHDLDLVDAFVAIRTIWMMGLHIEIAIDEGWLDDAYFDKGMTYLKDAVEK